MLYVDTSVLVAALTKEAETARMQRWLSRQDPTLLVISDWVATEFSAALSIKLRTGQIAIEDRAGALSAFTRLAHESFSKLSIAGRHFRIAARFADQHRLAIRAGDALHLALAVDHGVTLCTLDKRLAEVGSKIAARTKLL